MYLQLLTEMKDSMQRIEVFVGIVAEIMQKQRQVKAADLPEHMSVTKVAEYLDIDVSTFYRNDDKIMLEPVLRIGKRPYYLTEDVAKMMKHHHEKNAHTYSKLAKKPTPKPQKKQ